MKTTIKYQDEIIEFDDCYAASRYLNSKKGEPILTITCGNNTAQFDNFYEADGFVITSLRREVADSFFNPGPKNVWQMKHILENKFGFWVAISKKGLFNIRIKDDYGKWVPFVFAKKQMFGLTHKGLEKFYNRYVNTLILK